MDDQKPGFLFRGIRKLIKLLGLRRAVVKLALASPSLSMTRFLLPYAGIPLDMSISKRLVALRDILVRFRLFDRPLKVLEIGTWCAMGSTKFFSENLPTGSTLFYMDTWKPWASQEDISSSKDKFIYKTFDELSTIAFRIAHDNVRKYRERSRCGFVGIVGSSGDVGDALEPASFDIVYIDGSHYYDHVLSDIQLAKKVVKPDGIILGDDYELEFPIRPELLEISRRSLKMDSVYHPDVPSGLFHPGVAMALYESFSSLNETDGLWWHRVVQDSDHRHT